MDFMKAIQGYKTLAATGAAIPTVPEAVHDLLVPYLANQGIIVTAHGEVWLVSLVMGAVGVVMRFITTTPVGQKSFSVSSSSTTGEAK